METKMCVRKEKHLNNVQALNNFKLKCAQKIRYPRLYAIP